MLQSQGNSAVRVEAGCCGAEAVRAALSVMQGVRAINGLDESAPIVVQGADPRDAETLVNELKAAGLTQVWVVKDGSR